MAAARPLGADDACDYHAAYIVAMQQVAAWLSRIAVRSFIIGNAQYFMRLRQGDRQFEF
jgi:hypothetical protein